MKKGLHPILAFTMLVALTLAVASIISVWAFGFFKTQAGNIENNTEDQLICQNAALYIKNTNYDCAGNCAEGAIHNITVTVVNSGKVRFSIDRFSFTNNTGYIYKFDVNQTSFSIGDVKNLFFSSNMSCYGINNSIQEVYLSSRNCPSTAYDSFPGDRITYNNC